MTSPIATIIVVTHNGARWRERQLAALAAQTERRWRLFVVDNASRPEERPALAAWPAGTELTQSETNLGFAEANNVAARRATTPYLAFLNPDAFPEPDWLSRLIEVAERHPELAAVGSTQWRDGAPGVLDGTGDVMHISGLAYRSGFGKRRAPPPFGESFSACAAAMLVRRDAFVAVGGFDGSYFCFFEDVDLGFRLRLAGWRVAQAPDAVVAHVGGGSTESRAFADFHGARNRLWTFLKCMPAPLIWPCLPLHIAATGLAATMALMSGRGWHAWRGIFAGMRGARAIWRARAVVQRSRRCSIASIAGALAWSPHIFIGRQPVIHRLKPSGRPAQPETSPQLQR